MSKDRGKSISKRIACKDHRQERYLHWLDRLFKGEVTPEEVKLRADKLKQVKGGK